MLTTGLILANSGVNDSSSGTTPWSNPGNITANDTVAASCSGAGSSQYLVARSFNLSNYLPTNASIVQVNVYFRARNVSGGTTIVNVQVQDDSSAPIGSSSNIAVSGTGFVDYNLGWPNQASFGGALTRGKVSAGNFGARIWFNTVDTIEVDSVSIEIGYDLPGAASNETPPRRKQAGFFEVSQSLVLLAALAVSAAPFVPLETALPFRALRPIQVEPPPNLVIRQIPSNTIVVRDPLSVRLFPRRVVQSETQGFTPWSGGPLASQTDPLPIRARRLPSSAFAESSAPPLPLLLPALQLYPPVMPVDMQLPRRMIPAVQPTYRRAGIDGLAPTTSTPPFPSQDLANNYFPRKVTQAESVGRIPTSVAPLLAPFPAQEFPNPVRRKYVVSITYHRPTPDAGAPTTTLPIPNGEFPNPRIKVKVTWAECAGRLPSLIPPAAAPTPPFPSQDFQNPVRRVRTLQPTYHRPAPDAAPYTAPSALASNYDWPNPRTPLRSPPQFTSDGSVTIKACPVPDPGWQAVFIEAPNYTSLYAIQSTPTLAAGCTLYWGNVQGTGSVTVWPDGTFSADYTVVSFDVKICKDGVVGAVSVQVVNPPLFKATEWNPPTRKRAIVDGFVASSNPSQIVPLPLPPPPVDQTNPRRLIQVTPSETIGWLPELIPAGYPPVFTLELQPPVLRVYRYQPAQLLVHPPILPAAILPPIQPQLPDPVRARVVVQSESIGWPADTIPKYPDPFVQRDWPNPRLPVRIARFEHQYPPFLVPAPLEQDITVELTGLRLNLFQGALSAGVVIIMNRLETYPKLQGATEYLLQPFTFTQAMGPTEIILSYTFAVAVYSGVDAAPNAILAGPVQTTRTTVCPMVTGGVVGTMYEVVCSVVTDAGQNLQQSAYVYIEPNLP